MRNYILIALLFVFVVIGISVANAQTWGSNTASQLLLQRKAAVSAAIDRTYSTVTSAQKAAASCDVQKAVKAALPSGFPFACEVRCACP